MASNKVVSVLAIFLFVLSFAPAIFAEGGEVASTADDLGDKMFGATRDAAHHIAPAANDLKDKASDTIHDAAHHIAPAANDFKDKASDTAKDAAHHIAPAAHDLKDNVADAAHQYSGLPETRPTIAFVLGMFYSIFLFQG